MANHDVVAIGASAGGLAALKRLVADLPEGLPASVLIVVHLSRDHRSILDDILDRSGPLRASFAEEGQKTEPGRIYIGPRDRHLLLDGDRLRLGVGPMENGARPAIDPLFRSCAVSRGPAVIGVVLTGNLSDGAAGLEAVMRCGGITVVQDPADAEYPEMPQSSLSRNKVDHVVTIAEMGGLLAELVALPAPAAEPPPELIRMEVAIAAEGRPLAQNGVTFGRNSLFVCPDCHGTMWEIADGQLVRYRCHIGHAHSEQSLDAGIRSEVDLALGSALRALDERVLLMTRLADRAREQQRLRLARHWEEKAKEYRGQLESVRRLAIRQAQNGSFEPEEGK